MGAMKAIYTDGQELMEAMIEAERFGPDGLLEILREQGWVTPTERQAALEHLREGRYGAVERILGGGVGFDE